MNRSVVEFKHNLNQNLFKANSFLQKNWFKILLVLVTVFIITRKDLNFQFALNNANAQAMPMSSILQPTAIVTGLQGNPDVISDAAVAEVSTVPEEIPKVETPAKPKKADDNKAQSFSNLGFIMNPTYAKRHNIDPAIVAEKDRIVKTYIKKYATVAVEEMKEYGIPASITLAQGLLESNAGDSRLAVDANNHFGIKCFSRSCQKGHCKNFTDDTHKDFFRTYPSVWESYRAHSLFLQRDRYKHLLNLSKKDYKGWAHGLKKAGYATDKRYAYKLISLIETLNLHQYDKK
jgi:flagellum-specific peptidoglycan hydrolase FlgJ